jgi:hypothetical protein
MRRLSLVLVCLALGCSDTTSPGDLGDELDFSPPDLTGDPGVELAQFAMDWAAAQCAHLMACGRLDAADLPKCLEEQALPPPDWDEPAAIAAGHLSLYEGSCIDAIRTARCDGEEEGKVAAACANVAVGHLSPGAPCTSDLECDAGFCRRLIDGGGLAGEGCPGTCVARGGATAPCDDDTMCDPALFCDLGTSSCTARATAGMACSGDVSCVAGLYCAGSVFDVDGNGTCTAPTGSAAMGAACDPEQSRSTDTPACASGLYCQVITDAGGSPTGAKCAARAAKDAACDPGSALLPDVDNPCADGNSCFASGAAAPACHPFGRDDAACTVDDDCASPRYCDVNTNTCKPKVATGSACDPMFQHCLAGSAAGLMTCFGADADSGLGGTCRAPIGFGGSCATGEDPLCATGSCGSDGHCAPVCQ